MMACSSPGIYLFRSGAEPEYLTKQLLLLNFCNLLIISMNIVEDDKGFHGKCTANKSVLIIGRINFLARIYQLFPIRSNNFYTLDLILSIQCD